VRRKQKPTNGNTRNRYCCAKLIKTLNWQGTSVFFLRKELPYVINSAIVPI